MWHSKKLSVITTNKMESIIISHNKSYVDISLPPSPSLSQNIVLSTLHLKEALCAFSLAYANFQYHYSCTPCHYEVK